MQPNTPSIAERWNNRALWQLVWPLVVEQLLAVTIGMVDTVMVTAVGEAAVSGVSLVDAINVLLIQLLAALATGGAVVASQYLGRRQVKEASQAGKQLMYTITAMAIGVMALTLAFRNHLLGFVYGHVDPTVMGYAQDYLWLSAVSYPFIAIYNAGAALFRSTGNSRVSMFTALLVNVLNIGGNALFIYVFGMGTAGAALSTLISRAAAAGVLLFLLVRPHAGGIQLRGLLRFKFRPAMVGSILKIGVPNGLENSMFQIGKLLTARIVSTFGTAAIAGNALAGVLGTFGNLSGAAIGLALLTVVGQCVGAGDYESAKRYTKKLMKGTFASMAVVCALLALLARPILGVFNLSADATAIALRCLLTFCVCGPFFWPQSFALPNALRAAGDAKFTMSVSVGSMWVFRIGSAFLLAYTFGLGVWGVWIAMVIDWVVRGGIFLWRWYSGRWRGKNVIA